jgi:hypothetical protein
MADEPGLNVEVGITLSRLAKQLADAEARMLRTAKRSEAQFAASNSRSAASFLQVRKAVDQTSSQIRNLGQSGRSAGGGLQNVGFQVQDIAVQIAGGTSATRALAQQLPQLASGFGPVGVAVGTLAAVGIPLLAAAFGTASDGGSTFETALKELGEAAAAYSGAVGAASLDTQALQDKFGTATPAARNFLTILRDLGLVRAEAAATATFSELLESFGEFDAEDLVGTANRFRELENIARAVRDEFDLTAPAARDVAAAMRELAEAETVSAQVQAADNLRALLIEAAGGIENMNAETRAFVEQLAAAGEATAGVQGNIEAAAGWQERMTAAAQAALGRYENMRTIAAGVADELSRAAVAAASLAAYDNLTANTGQTGPDAVRTQQNGGGRFTPQVSGAGLARPKATRGGGGGGGGSSSTDSADILEQGQREIEQLQQRMEMMGKTTSEIARMTAEYELLNAAKRAGLDLDAVSATTGMTLRDSISAQAAQIADLTVKYKQAQERGEFFNEMQQELQDGFVNAIVDGQNFAGVLADIAKQLAKAFLQAALFGGGPLGGSGTGLLGGLFKGLPGFAGGGYTGSGGRFEPAGIVHRGEYVFDAATVRRMGVRQLDDMRRGLKGYANGGFVGGGAAAAVNVTSKPIVQVAYIDDPDRIGQYLASNPDAERAVMRIVKRNGL